MGRGTDYGPIDNKKDFHMTHQANVCNKVTNNRHGCAPKSFRELDRLDTRNCFLQYNEHIYLCSALVLLLHPEVIPAYLEIRGTRNTVL